MGRESKGKYFYVSSRDTGIGHRPADTHLYSGERDKYDTSHALRGARRHPAGAHRGRGRRGPAVEAELGREYGVSRVTVRRALERAAGRRPRVTARQGVGWFVAVDPVRQSLGRVTTVEAALEAAGAHPTPPGARVHVRTGTAGGCQDPGPAGGRRGAAGRTPEPGGRRAVRGRDGLGAPRTSART